MLLHLGKSTSIPLKNIIAIIDVESTDKSEYTKAFLKSAKENGNIDDISENTKSYIITQEIKKDKSSKKKVKVSRIYTSNISTLTLQKRAGFIEDIN